MQKILVLVLISLSVIRCTSDEKAQSSPPTRSPFEDNQVIFSGFIEETIRQHNKGQLTAASVIPTGETFEFVIKDTCVVDRSKKTSQLSYLIDDYVDLDKLVTDQELLLDESVIAVQLSADMTVGELTTYTRVDECIIGVTDQVKAEVQSANAPLFNDPNFSQQKYLSEIGFDKADLFMKTHIDSDIKVRVAVIDSGYDLGSIEQGALSPDLEGSDRFDLDDVPQDTLGHGTEVANLLTAKADNNHGIVGVGYRHIELLPIRLFGGEKSRQITGGDLFDVVKRSVNMGAEVINMSFSSVVDREFSPDETYEEKRERDKKLICSPIIGHAIQRAIERKAFFTLSAGHGVAYRKHMSGPREGRYILYRQLKSTGKFILDSNTQPVPCSGSEDGNVMLCKKYPVPGQVISPKDNETLYFGNTSFPACWGRYFKGAVTVGAVGRQNDIASFSNYGEDSVELAAPGVDIATVSLGNKVIQTQGTSFSAPLAAGAAAMIIAFHKQQQRELEDSGGDKYEWYYSPWLVEDILVNSTRKVASLEAHTPSHDSQFYAASILSNGKVYNQYSEPGGQRVFRKGRFLHLGDLSDYLLNMKGQSYNERRAQESDNKEFDRGFDPENSDDEGVRIIGLQAYTEMGVSRNRDRVQVQAVAYFSNGSTRVITDEAEWSTTEPENVPIDSQGIAYPRLDYVGVVDFTAKWGGRTSKPTSFFVADVDVVSGSDSLIPVEIKNVIVGEDCSALSWRTIAYYENGGSRNVTYYASHSLDRPLYQIHSGWLSRALTTRPGEELTFTSFYYGKKAQLQFTSPECQYLGDDQVKVDLISGDRPNQAGYVGVNTQSVDKRLGVQHDFGEHYNSKNYNINVNPMFALDGEKQEIYHANLRIPLPDGTTEIPWPLGDLKFTRRIGPILWTSEPELFIDVDFSMRLKKTPLISLELSQADTYLIKPNRPSEGYNWPAGRFYAPQVYGTYADGKRVFSPPGVEITMTHADGRQLEQSRYPYVYENKLGIPLKITLRNDEHNVTRVYDVDKTYGRKVFTTTSTEKRTFTSERFESGHPFYEGVTIFENSVQNDREADPICSQGTQDNGFQGGTGTVVDPLLVCTTDQLKLLVKKNTTNPHQSLSKYIKLMNHMDLSGWKTEVDESIVALEVDGNGYELRNYLQIGTENNVYHLFRMHSQHGTYGRPVVKFKNIGFRNFFTKTNAHTMIGATGLDNVYVADVIIDNDTNGALFHLGSAAGVESLFVVNTKIYAKRNVSAFIGSAYRYRNIYMNVEMRTTGVPGSGGSVYGLSESFGRFGSTSLLGQDCIEEDVVTNFDCDFVASNILMKGKINSNGIAVGLFESLAGTIVNSSVQMDIQTQGDGAAGFVNKIRPNYDYSDVGVIYNSSFKGNIHGRDNIGGIAALLAGGGGIYNCTVDGILKGSEYVGGLVASKGQGYAALVDNNLENVQVESSGRHKSDLIGHYDNSFKESKDGKLVKVFDVPFYMSGNRFAGSFLSENQADLIPAIEAIVNAQ